MDAFAVPGDVLTVLTEAGLRPTGSLGPTSWLAVTADGDEVVELHVVPVPLDDGVAARAAALCAVPDEHLPRVHAVVPLGPGRCGLVVDHVVGLPLDRLRAARAPLSDGEAVTVAVPVAGALAALHHAGLAHGAVRADAIVVAADGRPVLTDLRATLLGTGTADEDLRRLLATLLDVLPGADAELLAGVDVGAPPTVRGELEVMLCAPACDAREIVARCFAAADPEPVRLPDAGAVAWAQAPQVAQRGARPADDPGGTAATRRARRAPGRAARMPGGEGRGQGRVRHGAAGRRRTGRRALALVAGVVLVGAVGVLVAQSRQSAVAADPVTVSPVTGGDPVAAAERLTRERARALAALDAAALSAVDAPGSPALAADRALVASLDAVRLEGVHVEVSAAPSVAAGPSTAAVAVTAGTSAYVRVAADGTRTEVPAGPPRTVVLDLRLGADGWRVWQVRGAG